MLRGKADGIGADDVVQRLTHERIRAYAGANPTVYLVAHDPKSAAPRRAASRARGCDGRGSVMWLETATGIDWRIEKVSRRVTDPRRTPRAATLTS